MIVGFLRDCCGFTIGDCRTARLTRTLEGAFLPAPAESFLAIIAWLAGRGRRSRFISVGDVPTEDWFWDPGWREPYPVSAWSAGDVRGLK